MPKYSYVTESPTKNNGRHNQNFQLTEEEKTERKQKLQKIIKTEEITSKTKFQKPFPKVADEPNVLKVVESGFFCGGYQNKKVTIKSENVAKINKMFKDIDDYSEDIGTIVEDLVDENDELAANSNSKEQSSKSTSEVKIIVKNVDQPKIKDSKRPKQAFKFVSKKPISSSSNCSDPNETDPQLGKKRKISDMSIDEEDDSKIDAKSDNSKKMNLSLHPNVEVHAITIENLKNDVLNAIDSGIKVIPDNIPFLTKFSETMFKQNLDYHCLCATK